MHTLEHELFRDSAGAWLRLVRVIRTPRVPIGLFVRQDGSQRGELALQRMTEVHLVDDDPLDDRATRVCGASAAVLRGHATLEPDEYALAHAPHFFGALRTATPDFTGLVRALRQGGVIATPRHI